MQSIVPENAGKTIGPYSPAVAVGDYIFVSGQIPTDPHTGSIVSNDIEEQTRQVLENLQSILAAAGSGMEKVVKTTVFIKDMYDFPKLNTIYAQYFREPYPARSCVEVARLPKDVLVEIEAIALK